MAYSESQRQLKAWIRRQGRRYLADPNITSVGIGYKQVGGKTGEEMCIQFTVRRKARGTELEMLETTPIPERIQTDGETVPTDVIERDYSLSYEIVPEAFDDDRRKRIDPLVPGVSISHPRVSAGTAGAIVYDRHTGEPAVLSNWHVLHGNEGLIGDEALQPGTHDDNRAVDNRFGRLTRSHLGVAGDAALAVVDNRGSDGRVLDLDVVPDEIADPDLGDAVVKSGRTTGVSHGVVSRVDVLVSLDYGEGAGEQTIGCFEIEPDPRRSGEPDHLSEGGDSGAVWLLELADGQPSTVMGGLHFAGSDDADGESALACYASSVRDKLEFSLSPETARAAALEETAGAGYDEDFLAEPVPVPGLCRAQVGDAVVVNDSTVVPYTHFSLTQSKERRLARWVAWNIDGGRLQRLSRDGTSFRYDGRIPEEHQAGEDLYRANDIDRGHIARRADLLWGPRAEAQRANEDSFYFTNIAPQLDDFNQSGRSGVWGQIEDALFAQVDLDGLRVSVMGGPVFKETDRDYRGYRIPREFFKVVYYVVAGELRVQAFVLSQDLADLEVINLAEFSTFQVTLADVETRTGLTFPAATPGAGGAQVENVRVVASVDDFSW